MYNNFLSSIKNLVKVQIFLLILIILLSSNSVIIFGQDVSIENLPPVSNPRLDSIKHPISNSVTVLEEVYFVGSDSYDPNTDDNLTYNWDFGDGSKSNEISPVYIYNRVGEYFVGLTLNDGNLTDTDTIKIIVISQGNHDPVIKFTTTAKKDELGNSFANITEQIIFDASESFDPDGFSLIYEWEFGDGNQDSGDVVLHQYEDDNIYTIKLRVTDQEGRTVVLSEKITIGTGVSDSSNGDNGNTGNDTFIFSITIIVIVIFIVLFLIILWLYLNGQRKRNQDRIEQVSKKISETDIIYAPPSRPEFSRKEVQIRDKAARQDRIDRLSKRDTKVKRSLLRDRMRDERKKVDDEMKKELDDMGIEL